MCSFNFKTEIPGNENYLVAVHLTLSSLSSSSTPPFRNNMCHCVLSEVGAFPDEPPDGNVYKVPLL